MEQIKTLFPWEERRLYNFESGRNKAISVGRFESLQKLVREDYETFWYEVAGDITWFEPWHTTLEGGIPDSTDFKFFAGGYSNVCYNMLDRHLEKGDGNRMALIWESESGDRIESYTYKMLHDEVCKFSNALTKLGFKKGDRMAVFLPNTPIAAIAILSAYRLGMAFTPLFTGLSVEALRSRMKDFKPQVLVTMDGTYRRGKVIPLKSIMDETLKEVPSIRTVVVKRHVGDKGAMAADRDHWFDELVADLPNECPAVPVEANELQLVMYTSGTAGTPKGAALAGVGLAVQTCLGGKIEAAMAKDDVFYSVNDNAWAGSECHAILPVWLNGATMVWQEGAAFITPSLGRFYSTIERYSANKVHLAPTVLRMLRAAGEEIISKYDLSGLDLMLCMGEPLSPSLWKWTFEKIGRRRMYLNNVGDMTELGGCIIQPAAFIAPMKPGAMGQTCSIMGGPAVGVIDSDGKDVLANTRGSMIFRRPLPGAARTLWNNHERYVDEYIRSFDGKLVWMVQDEAVIDEDGYFWVLGRLDDTINVAGHRMTTSEIEGAIIQCPEVEAAAVIGVPDPIKEQVPSGFIKLREGVPENDDTRKKINDEVARRLGSYAKLGEIFFLKKLPSTISGKIMRRVLRDIRVTGEIKGDLTTLDDPESIELLKNAMDARKKQ
jgi:acetyl-CoA synthetase